VLAYPGCHEQEAIKQVLLLWLLLFAIATDVQSLYDSYVSCFFTCFRDFKTELIAVIIEACWSFLLCVMYVRCTVPSDLLTAFKDVFVSLFIWLTLTASL